MKLPFRWSFLWRIAHLYSIAPWGPRHGGATLATNDQNKIKENFESNPSAQSSKEEVEKYNKVVNEMNKAAQASNTSTQN
ncbi:MAG TPA: hypothetical protein PL045_09495 [Chitinophagaceae bacterium]|nr:hypothetical protein [Chitinophagaceae bacterium]